jgi:diaminopropionate ammonia-lyase
MPREPANRELLTLLGNPDSVRSAQFGADARAAFEPHRAASARAELRTWPGYAPTPLVELPGLAARTGVAAIYAKNEGLRTEIASFKALGGPFALAEHLKALVRRETSMESVSSDDLLAGRHVAITSKVTASCASEGNHGRSVAWGAKLLGCQSVIYLPTAVSGPRVRSIESLGARVERVEGTYDDALRNAIEDSGRNGWQIISDTAYGGYTEIPRQVMHGYSLIIDEALSQLPRGISPTHVFLQAGCGSFAAAMSAHLWHIFGARRPTIVSVEPLRVACVLESIRAQRMTAVHGDHRTVMGGLACGEVSALAWPILRLCVDFCLAMPDEFTLRAMQELGQGIDGDSPLRAGESGAAGAGGLLALSGAPRLAEATGLGADSVVLLFVTEGATDPESWRRILEGPPVHTPGP